MIRGSSLLKMCSLPAVAISLFAGTAFAQTTIVVTDQTQAGIQQALRDLGGPGTVVLPPGRYRIDGTLTILNDRVTLQGSGSGSDETVLFRTRDGTNTAMVRSTGHSWVRVTGIRFEGVSAWNSNGREVGVLLEGAENFRVDNCFFTHTGFAGVRTNGASWGVVHHCTFEELYKPRVADYGYGVAVFGTNRLEHVPFGSDRATFVEDSSFTLCRHAVASNKGARYVFRSNYVAQNEIAHAVDAHGTEYGSAVGTEWIDVHDNLIEDPIYQGYAVRIRGGKGLIWNNTFLDYHLGIRLTQETPEATGRVYIWDNYISPEASPMVRAEGASSYAVSRPRSYTPYPYPHPLTQL
jgi:hypothetical protein